MKPFTMDVMININFPGENQDRYVVMNLRFLYPNPVG